MALLAGRLPTHAEETELPSAVESALLVLVERVLSADEVASAAFPEPFRHVEPLGEPGGSGESSWRATSEEFGDVVLKVLVRASRSTTIRPRG